MTFPAKLVPAVVCIALAVSAGLLRAEENAEWTDLLPEGNFKKHWTTTGNWTSADGAATLTPREGEQGWSRFDAYLWSNKEYDDFEIEFEYKVEPRGNSGFYFNVGDKKSPVDKGIEVQIYDSGSKAEGAKLTDHDSGGVIPGVPPTKNAAKPAGEWNKFNITVKGDQLTVKLNGQVVNELDLTQGRVQDRPKSGYIGFQDHALPLSLRNIKIREL